MNGRKTTLVATAGLVALCCWLATACLRLNEPEGFSCANTSDCLDGEKCFNQVCSPGDVCNDTSDCSISEICENSKCKAAQCYPGAGEAVCGNYLCDQFRKTCFTSCPNFNECKPGFVCGVGRVCIAPPPQQENGTACKFDYECKSQECCASTTGQKCQAGCEGQGASCQTADTCSGGHCCQLFSGGKGCSMYDCPKLLAGGACMVSTDCASMECLFGICS